MAMLGCSPVSTRKGPAPGCSMRKAGIGTHSQLRRERPRPSPRGSAKRPEGRASSPGGAPISPVSNGRRRTVASGRPPGPVRGGAGGGAGAAGGGGGRGLVGGRGRRHGGDDRGARRRQDRAA